MRPYFSSGFVEIPRNKSGYYLSFLESLVSVGGSTSGLQCTYQPLENFELPFIAHWKGYHCIIVYGISKDHIWVADSALGFKKMTRSHLQTRLKKHGMCSKAFGVNQFSQEALKLLGYRH